MNRLRAGLESVKEDLLRTHTELAAVKVEADRVSHALTGVKLDLEREGRTCKTLEADVKDLRVQLLAAQEAQRVPEEVSRFLATTAEVQLQQPEITGLAVPVAFTLHVPVQRDGECEYETMTASCRRRRPRRQVCWRWRCCSRRCFFATQAKILRVRLASLAASSILHGGLMRSSLRPTCDVRHT